MKKSQGKGNGNKHKNDSKNENKQRDLQIKEADQEYGQVLKLLGNCRVEVQCFDGIKRLGHIRGNMRKKVWISVGDIVLTTHREYQDAKCDIILRYTPDEVRTLKKYNHISDKTDTSLDPADAEQNKEEEDIGFSFEDI